MLDHEFESGAHRSRDADHVRYDLISPKGLKRLAATYHEGAVKYAALNWELGMPIHDLLNHSIKHEFTYLEGDRAEDHLAHAAWGLLAAIHSEEMWPDLNRPHLRGPGCTLTQENIMMIKKQLQDNVSRRLEAARKAAES